MKKRSLVVYCLLFIFLIVVSVMANVSNKKSEDLQQSNSSEFSFNSIKQAFSSQGENEKHYEKDISNNITKVETGVMDKFKSHEFSTYPSVEDNTIVYKKMYKVYSNTKCGLINEDGVKVSKSVYDDFEDFDKKNGIYRSKLNGKSGLMNHNGKILIPAKFESIIQKPNTNFCIVKNHSYQGIYDIKRAKAIASVIYTSVESLDVNNWKVISGKKVGLVNYNNKGKIVLIKPKYDNIVLIDGYLKTFSNNKFGIISLSNGYVISEPKYDAVDLINVGEAITKGTYIFKIRLEDRYGLIFYSKETSLVIPPIYTQVSYTNGLVRVVSNGNVQYLDEKGSIETDKKKIGNGK